MFVVNKEYEDIAEYEGLYVVYTDGTIRSLDRYVDIKNRYGGINHIFKQGTVIKHIINNRGYHTVHLHKNGVQKTYLVSRLVANAFIPNPNNLPEVDHIDENKDNNCVSNLRWCTRQFNNTRGVQSRDGREKSSEFRMKKVGMYDRNGTLIRVYKGIRIAGRDMNLNNTNIAACCKLNLKLKGRAKNNHTCGGYIWRYM